MSRFHRYKQALVSGYFLLGANIVYSLASVPLALAYLSRSEFGLWALMAQIAGYILLIDLGMTGSVSRILVDYKDESGTGAYGSMIVTSSLVGLVQGALVLLSGGLLSIVGARLLHVPGDLAHQFAMLLLGQSALQAFAFSCRILMFVLTAHQRYDVINYSQAGLFGVNYAALWAGFALGFGVYSSLWAQALAQFIGVLINGWWCFRLKLMPKRGAWGKPTWPLFKELFEFGKDFFMFALGSQMVNASQTIVVTPLLGLEAAGLWAVCTRAYTVVCQLVWRILDYSATPLSEMFVRGEQRRFFERFRSITIITGSMAAVCGVLFAFCNQPFVLIWAKGRFGWSAFNDILLGFWLVLISVQRCHCGLLGVKKQLRTVKYIYFGEGILFVCLASITSRYGGFEALIASSIAATLSLSFAYGLWRTKIDFGLEWKEVFSWLYPAGRLLVLLSAVALGIGWLTASLSPVTRLVGVGLPLGVVAAACLLRWGLDGETQRWVSQKLPGSLQPLLGSNGGQPIS